MSHNQLLKVEKVIVTCEPTFKTSYGSHSEYVSIVAIKQVARCHWHLNLSSSMAAGIMLLLIVSMYVMTECKRYDLPQSWSVTNNNRLPQFEAAQGIGHYRLIPAAELILSDNATFGLCFFSFNSTSSYYLSVVMGTSYYTNASSSAVVIWTANRNEPIPENGTLRLGVNGTVELRDDEHAAVWSRPHGGGISGIELQESGNLVFYNSTGGATWQSFDEPTDVILDSQNLRSGQELSGSLNSTTLVPGSFKLKVEASGLVFLLSLPGQQPQPYYLWTMWNQGNSPADMRALARTCPTYETIVQYKAPTVNMFYQKISNLSGNTASCGPPLSASLSGTGGSLHHLKLDHRGNLVQVEYDAKQGVWRTSADFLTLPLRTSCRPMTCQAHSICRAESRCQCLVNMTNNTTDTCQATSPLPLICNELEAENHHFMNVSGVTYFSTKYTEADKVASLDECWSLCLSNCSCNALFYNNAAGSCYFVNSIHGSLTEYAGWDGFLKLQNWELVLPKKTEEERVKAIAFGVSGSTVLVLVFVGGLGAWLWRKQMNRVAGTVAIALQGSLHRFSYKELSVATGKFSSVIGHGGSGCVYEGVLRDGTQVAIKKLESTSQGQKQFMAEVCSIGSISHVNVVKLRGFCVEKSRRLLVYEHVVNGSLDKWLSAEGDGEPCLHWKTRFNIAIDVAKGLSYLHEKSRQLIMHLDIKPENILLDEQFAAKLSDFGVSKLFVNTDVSHATTTVRGTPGYLAPEWLLHSVATKKCDVYSYGMVLLELIGGRRNLDSSMAASNDEKWYFPAWAVDKFREGQVIEIIDKKVSAEASEDEARRLVHVALWCIQEDPSLRPTMDSVVQMLEGRKEVLEPPMCFHFAIQSPGIISISTTGSKASVSSITVD